MDKIATLVGCAIGDALGNPFEMKLSNNPALIAWDGQFKEGGTFWWGQPGQYTDDTLMSIALAQSLIENQGYDPSDVAQKYLAWMESGNTRGIGVTTAESINNIKLGFSWSESGLKGPKIGGNGTAMRVSPIGLAYRFDLPLLIEKATIDASITHNSLEPKMGSVAVALGIALLANGIVDKSSIIEEISNILCESIVKDKMEKASFHLKEGTEAEFALADIGSSGYVPETVAAAFFCFSKTQSFKDCVIMSIKCGGDTDTTAAVAGALAGTYYGLENIPNEYKDGVEDFNLLNSLTENLINIKI